MRQAYHARITARLAAGSDEKRAALEQVRLAQRMIGRHPAVQIAGRMPCFARQDREALQLALPGFPKSGKGKRKTIANVRQAGLLWVPHNW